MPAGWVSAGAAAIGAGESIAGNKAAASATKQNNQNSAVLSGAQNTMLNQAEAVANQPFQAYTGDLTAPMSGNQQLGYNLAANTAASGAAQADVNKGTGLLDSITPWSQSTAQQYMNPYTQDVTQNAIDASNKTYLQNLTKLQAGEGGTSAFGGSRAAVGQATMAADQNINVGQLTATGNANAYDSAMKAWSADNQAKVSAANAYSQAGNDINNMNSTQIADLLKTGGVSQVISQTNLNNQYGQFMRQQGWSAQQLGPLINAVQAGKGGVAQTAPVQSNTANQLLGLGSTLAGLFGGGSTSAGNSGAPSSAEIGAETASATTGANSLSNIPIDAQMPAPVAIEGETS